MGVNTAAACRLVGAAGVGLDFDLLCLMPESPLPKDWQDTIRSFSGQETSIFGERLEDSVRLVSNPRFPLSQKCRSLEQQLELESESLSNVNWRSQLNTLIGWDSPQSKVWPLGQAVGMAKTVTAQYRTTGRFIQALLKASRNNIQLAQKLTPLAPQSALAQSHGTHYPIVQGPMTRVSDVAEFANAVAAGGALPMLALAMMRGSQVTKLLEQTKSLVGSRSWGIGILGFIPHALREEQLAAVRKFKPSFALIAGGRPDQAVKLEQEGIQSYIHVPTASLLELFLNQGARRFVFEGRECGGHVGPLSSFTLWENAIAFLLNRTPSVSDREIHVLFAGGIHDAQSAAMVSAMAAPLVARGIKVGVLIGTAYLFTQEAVASEAIVEEYQKQALQCSQTINLETGPGHASRCAVSPFAKEFYRVRNQMLKNADDADMIKDTLEDLTLGRLRLASKGIERTKDGLVLVDTNTQSSEGMYMIGQVATLRDYVCTVKELHETVSQESIELLFDQSEVEDLPLEEDSSSLNHPQEDIAIIGIGTLLPGAQNVEDFWQNTLNSVNAITEIPAHRWDWRLYYDADIHSKDKVYSKWGGFLNDIPFDPMRFGIPPKSLESIEPMQLLTLEVVRRALADAGYENGDFDREHTSVILGASGGMSDLGQQYATRAEIPRRVERTVIAQ